MTIIEQLKANEKPFGLMSEEMQEKARGIGKKEFEWFATDWTSPSRTAHFPSDCTYRLRPDYADEPEIRQREIAANNSNCLCMYNDEGQSFGSIANVHERPDFIGFKFEDGSWHDHAIKPVDSSGQLEFNFTLGDIERGVVRIAHATAVLFRRQKGE